MPLLPPFQLQKILAFFYSAKVKWVYLAVGIALVLFSIAGHALSFDASVPGAPFVLQQGSSISFDASILIDSDHPLTIHFDAKDNPFVKLDGQLGSTLSQDSFSRQLKIIVSPLAPVGEYHLILDISANDGSYSTVQEKDFQVNVVQKTGSYYSTTPNTNIPPFISTVQFSKTQLNMDRDQTDFVQVSFTNSGSLTDFHVFFVQDPAEFSAVIQNPYLLRLAMGESQQVLIQFDTNASTKLGNELLILMAQDVASGKQFQLGTIALAVQSRFDARAFSEKTVYQLTEGQTLDSFITVDNRSTSAQQFHLISNSEMIQFSDGNDFTTVPAKTIQKIPFQIVGKNAGIAAARIGLNAESNSLILDFTVKVIPAPKNNSNSPSSIQNQVSGLIGGSNSFFLGLIALVILAGFYFVFREKGKPKVPEAKTDAPSLNSSAEPSA